MTDYPIIQLRLSSGEEIICECINDDELDVAQDLFIRKAILIDQFVNEDHVRSYTMRSFMVYQDGLDQIININSDHVIAKSTPTRSLLEQYYNTLIQTTIMHHAREGDADLSDSLLDSIKLSLLETQEFLASTSDTLDQVSIESADLAKLLMEDPSLSMIDKELYDSASSGKSNVISFKSKKDDTFH